MKRDNRTENKIYKGEPRRVVFEEDGWEPVYNERGIIAENYNDLQGLGVLASAKETYPLPRASDESTLRAVYQAAEIALLNLADVVARAAVDLRTRNNRFGGTLPSRIGPPKHDATSTRCDDAGGLGGVLRIREPPAFAFREYVKAIRP